MLMATVVAVTDFAANLVTDLALNPVVVGCALLAAVGMFLIVSALGMLGGVRIARSGRASRSRAKTERMQWHHGLHRQLCRADVGPAGTRGHAAHGCRASGNGWSRPMTCWT